jgi:hypothetical protein
MARTKDAIGKKQHEKSIREKKGQTTLAFGHAGGLIVKQPASLRGMIGQGLSVLTRAGMFASSSSSSSSSNGAAAAHVSTTIVTEETGSKHDFIFYFFHIFVLFSFFLDSLISFSYSLCFREITFLPKSTSRSPKPLSLKISKSVSPNSKGMFKSLVLVTFSQVK